MKETVKTSRTAGYLEKMFRTLNADWFGGELEEPIITIQSTPRAYGHVTVAKAWRRKDDWRHELNLGAETLDRPIEDVAATMMHEMVHLYNIAHNVQDTSRGGMYHNRRFRDEAERRGLVIGRHEKYGWTLTEPGVMSRNLSMYSGSAKESRELPICLERREVRNFFPPGIISR